MRLGLKNSFKAFVRIKFEFLRRSKIVHLLFIVTVCGVLRSDGVLEIPTLAGIGIFAEVIIDFLKAILEFFVGQFVHSGVLSLLRTIDADGNTNGGLCLFSKPGIFELGVPL